VGSARSFTATQLQPYTNYTVVVDTCSTGACGAERCTSTSPMVVETAATQPGPIQPPSVSVTLTTSLAVSVSWQPPAMPNGRIISYRVIRNGNTTVYSGLGTTAVDTTGLAARTSYVTPPPFVNSDCLCSTLLYGVLLCFTLLSSCIRNTFTTICKQRLCSTLLNSLLQSCA
jgi:hypothetical protein